MTTWPAEDLILQTVDVGKEFPGAKVLSEVNLAVRRGEILAICGANGAGKSTLVHVLSGVHPYGSYEGQILYNGYEMQFTDVNHSEQAGIVIIHQESHLIPQLSLAENIFIGHERMKGRRIDWKKTHADAEVLLQRVGLNASPEITPAQLGIGEQQLVQIAKALSKNVELLILDEPTAALSDADSAHLLDLLRQLKAEGVTSIIISHKLHELAQVADRVTILRDGQTVDTLPYDTVEPITEDRIISAMVGRPLESRFPEHAPHISGEALRLAHWNVYNPNDPKQKVINDVNLYVRHGEIVGLAGLMGAGRTELALSLFGHSYGKKISGLIYRDGREVHIKNVHDAIAHGIGYATEDRRKLGLNLVQTLRENVSAAALHKVSNRGVVAADADVQTAEKYRKDFQIRAPHTEAVVGQLSGGNQQKVMLSKWVHTDADVLILDEPTRGIDVGSKYEIYRILNDLADDGKAIIVISSDLPELLGICDRIYTMNQGVINGEFLRSEFSPELLMQYLV